VNPMALYPPVQLPVSSSTPFLSHLVHWDHSETWPVPTGGNYHGLGTRGSSGSGVGCVEVDASSSDSEDMYLTGHVIDGRVLLPVTFYLVLAWKQLANMHGLSYEQTPVCFEDVNIQRDTILPPSGKFAFCMLLFFV